jgi:hypothetical protein
VLAVARRYFATGGACTSWVALLARSSLHAVTQQRFTLFEAYHLIPIADALRRRGHANQIGFFLHVPMPPPEVLMSLPNHETLIPLLLQYDVAVVLRRQDFTALPGISIIVACLAINQLAYVIAIWWKSDPNEGNPANHLPQQGLDDVPRDNRSNDIHHQHKRHHNAHFNPGSRGGLTWRRDFKGRA